MTQKINKNKSRKPTLLIIISTIVVSLALVQIFLSCRLATLGEKLRELEKRASQLEEENRIMVEKISEEGALSKISLRAEELGFVRTTSVLHLTSPLPMALK